MADERLVERLKEGVQGWNKWREANAREEIDLTKANLEKLNLRSADLSGAQLSGACLRAANLERASLFLTQLDGADLRSADLRLASLHGTNLSGADLSNAVLFLTHFEGVNVTGANFSMARFARTSFTDTDLSEANGLKEAVHLMQSFIGIDTVYLSQGKIPFEFLRGAGIPENFIEYMHSLVGTGFEYYSCFISYSTKDEDFAEGLHADLQNNGVRCWFAPHDAKAGVKLDRQIDQAIRLHEKVLLILSPDSIQSDWVKRDQEGGEAPSPGKERCAIPGFADPFQGITGLGVLGWRSGEDLAAEIREYLVPDFSHWKNHDSYKKAFDKLLRDLQSGKTKA